MWNYEKKITVSNQYQNAKCEAGSVHYEPVWWPGVQ